jgi:hypothetical protein
LVCCTKKNLANLQSRDCFTCTLTVSVSLEFFSQTHQVTLI